MSKTGKKKSTNDVWEKAETFFNCTFADNFVRKKLLLHFLPISSSTCCLLKSIMKKVQGDWNPLQLNGWLGFSLIYSAWKKLSFIFFWNLKSEVRFISIWIFDFLIARSHMNPKKTLSDLFLIWTIKKWAWTGMMKLPIGTMTLKCQISCKPKLQPFCEKFNPESHVYKIFF